MRTRSFLLAALITLSLFLASCGSSPQEGQGKQPTEASSPKTVAKQDTTPSKTKAPPPPNKEGQQGGSLQQFTPQQVGDFRLQSVKPSPDRLPEGASDKVEASYGKSSEKPQIRLSLTSYSSEDKAFSEMKDDFQRKIARDFTQEQAITHSQPGIFTGTSDGQALRGVWGLLPGKRNVAFTVAGEPNDTKDFMRAWAPAQSS